MCRSVCLGVLERGIGSLEMQLSRQTRDTSASAPPQRRRAIQPFVFSVSSGSFAPPFNPVRHFTPPKRAFLLGAVHGRERDRCFHSFFFPHPLPRLLLSSCISGKVPPGRRTSPAAVLEASPKPDFFFGVREKDIGEAMPRAIPIGRSMVPRRAARILKFLCYACRTWRQVAGI